MKQAVQGSLCSPSPGASYEHFWETLIRKKRHRLVPVSGQGWGVCLLTSHCHWKSCAWKNSKLLLHAEQAHLPQHWPPCASCGRMRSLPGFDRLDVPAGVTGRFLLPKVPSQPLAAASRRLRPLPRTLSTGHRAPDTGIWALGTSSGHWALGTGHRTRHWAPGTRHWEPGNGHWALESGHRTLSTGHWTLTTGPWTLTTGHWELGTGGWTLSTGHWTLSTGHLALSTGHWALSSGHRAPGTAPALSPPWGALWGPSQSARGGWQAERSGCRDDVGMSGWCRDVIGSFLRIPAPVIPISSHSRRSPAAGGAVRGAALGAPGAGWAPAAPAAGTSRAGAGGGCGKRWGTAEKAEPGAGGGFWSSPGGDAYHDFLIVMFQRRRSYSGNTQNVGFATDGNSAYSPVLGVVQGCGPKFLVRVQVMTTW